VIKLPSGVEIKYLIDDLRIIGWEANDILLSYSKILKDSNGKSNILENGNLENPVTMADLKVNEAIIRRIKEKYKETQWEILSEENAKLPSEISSKGLDWNWVLDPLDGTKDFIQCSGNYAMHLALNYKKKPYLGIVLIPEKGELWIADGENVWCEKKNGTKVDYSFNKNKSLKEMILVTSVNHKDETLEKLIKEIQFNKVISMGSIGCKIASIIRGDSDLYICLSMPGKSSPKDWDFASPEIILKTAGGEITNIHYEELEYGDLNYEQGGIIVASSNKLMHKKICSEIKKIIKENDLYPL